MLLIVAVVVSLSALGALVVAKVALVAMKRLGLEFWSVMFWFGLVDAPVGEMVVRKFGPQRLKGNAAPARRRPLPENL